MPIKLTLQFARENYVVNIIEQKSIALGKEKFYERLIRDGETLG